MSGRLLDPSGRCERVPAREVVHLFKDKPDDYRICVGPQYLFDYTAGELRALAAKGQAIDLPVLLPDPLGIWEIGS